jgi:outer membrane receptor for ferric coprogen and ferric-rhodotorulic acid
VSIQTSNSKNPNFTLESTTEISKSDSVYSYDYDWMNPGYRGNTDIDFESFDRDTQGGSFDIRLLSSTNSRIFDESTEWIAGIYTKQHQQKLINTRIQNDILKTNYNSKFSSDSAALYSELTSYISNTTQISYGLRIEEWNSKHTDSNNFDRNKSETLYGGNISLNSTFDDNLIYANSSRGYKAGGFNSDQSLDENLIEFDTEYNISTELGIKSYSLGGALTTNIAVFYISRENMQTNNSYTPDDGDTYIIAINNAASGRNYGLEAEGNYSISKRITLNASLGLLETEINDYTQPYTFIDISGRKQSHSPSYSFSTSLDFKITKNITSSIEFEGKDDFYFSDSNNATSESYELLHASISYRMSNWDISLTGKNLTNKNIETRGFSGWVQDPQFYVDPTTAYPPGKYTQFGEPRLITLQGRYSF